MMAANRAVLQSAVRSSYGLVRQARIARVRPGDPGGNIGPGEACSLVHEAEADLLLPKEPCTGGGGSRKAIDGGSAAEPATAFIWSTTASSLARMSAAFVKE